MFNYQETHSEGKYVNRFYCSVHENMLNGDLSFFWIIKCWSHYE